MKYIWLYEEFHLLTIREEPGYGFKGGGDDRVFASFQDAYQAMRERIASFAAEESDVFDGHGNINGLKKLMEEDWDDPSYTAAEALELLRAFCMGEDISVKEGWTFDIDRVLHFRQMSSIDEAGPDPLLEREVFPRVHINAFYSGQEPQDAYHFEVHSRYWAKSGDASLLFFALKRIELEE